MMNSNLNLASKTSLCATLLLMTGCSTIINNRSQTIDIYTTKNQTTTAEVHAPKQAPYTLTVPNKIHSRPSSFDAFTVKVTDPCFKPYSININKSIHPSYWANVFTYFVGFPLDYVSGYMWEYDKSTTLALYPSDDSSDICSKKIAALTSELIAPNLKKPPNKHQISAGLIVQAYSKRFNAAEPSAGFFVEYSQRLHSELMSTVKWAYDSGNSEYNYDCQRFWSCSTNIETRAHSFELSLRHYINTKTNFYAGLGVAQYFISQEIGYSANSKTSATSSSSFFSLGWQTRRHKPALHFNATIDFAELHLASPKLNYYDERPVISNKSLANKADTLLKNAAMSSHISIGFTAGF